MSVRIISFCCGMRVPAKARPRITKTGIVYTPTSKKEREIANAMAVFKRDMGIEAIDEFCRVDICVGKDWFEFSITPLPDHPKKELRGDLDNYAKTLLDAAQKAELFTSDNLVRELEIVEVLAELEDV